MAPGTRKADQKPREAASRPPPTGPTAQPMEGAEEATAPAPPCREAPPTGAGARAEGGGRGADAEGLARPTRRGGGLYGEVRDGYGAAYEEAREEAEGPDLGHALGEGLGKGGQSAEGQGDDHDAPRAEAGGEAPAEQGPERGHEGGGGGGPTCLARHPVGRPRERTDEPGQRDRGARYRHVARPPGGQSGTAA